MNKIPLSGFYSLSKAAKILSIPRSQILRYAHHHNLPLYMVIDYLLPYKTSATEYGKITVPDDLMNLAISIYEEDDVASLFDGFHQTHWFPESVVMMNGNILKLTKDQYEGDELSFEELFINGDELNQILGLTPQKAHSSLKSKRTNNLEESSRTHSKALRILVQLHLGKIPKAPKAQFLTELKATIKTAELRAELNDNIRNWHKFLHEYHERKANVSSVFKLSIKILAINYHGPFSNGSIKHSSPDQAWLKKFYKKLQDEHMTTLTELQWRNILS